jgi:predicted membrane protein
MLPSMLPSSLPNPAPRPHTARLWVGIGIIVFGILALLDNLDFVPEGFFLRLWPVVLIIIGLGRFSRRNQEGGLMGYLLILGGIFLIIVNFGKASLVATIWPFFIVAFGVFMVTKALRKGRGVPPELAAHDSFLSATAIFGGSKRKVVQQDFRGAELTAIFGGFELDLRQAVLENDQVRVDVFVLFGSGEIKVPSNWAVTMKGSALMGGYEDRTLHMPSPETGGRTIHLVVTGLVLLGGLSVTN